MERGFYVRLKGVLGSVEEGGRWDVIYLGDGPLTSCAGDICGWGKRL